MDCLVEFYERCNEYSSSSYSSSSEHINKEINCIIKNPSWNENNGNMTFAMYLAF
jgi:hypothetical protein